MSEIKKGSYAGEDITLDLWLKLIETRPENILFADHQFPTDNIKEQFLSNISSYSEEIVTEVLDSFLLSAGPIGFDELNFESFERVMENSIEEAEMMLKSSRYLRNLVDHYLYDGDNVVSVNGQYK